MRATDWPGIGWFQMSPSGMFVAPLELEPGDFDPRDVAHHLAGIRRFTGGTEMTVAQHCCAVADTLRDAGFGRDYQLAGLLHDAPEAYGIGDLAGPIKKLPEFAGYREVENRIARTIERAVGLPEFAFDWKPVKAADVEVFSAEVHWLMPRPGNRYARPTVKWLGKVVTAWPSWLAERKYLGRYMELTA